MADYNIQMKVYNQAVTGYDTLDPASNATIIAYSNIDSGLVATNAQAAIDESLPLIFNNTDVVSTAWVSDSTYLNWAYKATIALSGVTSSMIPMVAYDPDTAFNGVVAPVATCYDGGVYLYASAPLSSTITIPTILCSKGII